MIGYFRTKISAFRESLAADITRVFAAALLPIDERLGAVEEQLRLAQRQERRNRLALDTIGESSAAALRSIQRTELESPPLESLLAFAASFLLALQSTPESRERNILRTKFDELLEAYELTAISEVFVPFDPERHEACSAIRLPDIPNGVVAQMVRPGFLRAGNLLRPAVVVVNRCEIPSTIFEEESTCSSRL